MPVSTSPLYDALIGLPLQEHLTSVPLTMTEAGIEQARPTLQGMKYPAVYVHTEGDKVLRIGKASSRKGVAARWVGSKTGHYATIEWGMRTTSRYTRANARQYAKYVHFFRLLHGRDTTLHVIDCDADACGAVEALLIDVHQPMWEAYKAKSHYDWSARDQEAMAQQRFDNVQVQLPTFVGRPWRANPTR